MKDKKDKHAELFSQLPLLIFTKGANISGGHCIYIFFYVYFFFIVNVNCFSTIINIIVFILFL